ncbi:MAG: DUF6062 family protein [Lachnospiraceae bacterium]
MKEKIYTIPLNDAVNAHDECPFCFIERKIERDTMDFVLGNSSSYMESDIRDMTDRAGFCKLHFKNMFDYGNTLGNAWILKTHYRRKITELTQQFDAYCPEKPTFKSKFQKKDPTDNPIISYLNKEKESCFICEKYTDTYNRYMDTFFYMYIQDEDFRSRIRDSKGFCMTHFGDLCESAETHLKDKYKEDFYKDMRKLMLDNMERVYEDVAWLVEKFDYRNKDADWKNSKDAIQRGMQKMKGGHPSDPVYKAD